MITLSFVLFFTVQAQESSLHEQVPGPEGIYLSGRHFLDKTPILKENIQSEVNKEDGEFYGKTLNKKKIIYTENGIKKNIMSDSVWGFVQNKTLFVNVQGAFYRVPVFGRISYFMAMVEVNQFVGTGFDPFTGMPVRGTTRTRELREFMILFDDSPNPVAFQLEKVENHLKNDPAVWAEYQNEKKKNRKKYITKYIRKYNSSHPL